MRRCINILSILFTATLLVLTSCEKEEEESPTVNTFSVTNIASDSAESGGNVIDNGSASVTSKGVVWSTAENPTVEDNNGKTDEGKGTGEFTSTVTNLTPNTIYYVRAYSTNSAGTGYGKQKKFTTLKTYDLIIEIEGEGSVNKEVIEQKSNGYEEGKVVKLTANPDEGWKFVEWKGDTASIENPIQITIDEGKEVTAVFEKNSYSLTVNTEGEGSVSEEVVEKKSNDYEHGTSVKLTANPNEGWEFIEWKGDTESSENPIQITVDESKEVTAVFEKKSYSLTVNTEGEGSVSEDVVEKKSTDYKHGTIIRLTAKPAKGWNFVEWKGDTTSSENPIQITIDQPKEVTAVFEKKSYVLTVNTEGEGTIVKDPDQSKYKYNTTVDLKANPAEGWKFMEWKGDISSNNSSTQITVDTTKEITAVFEKKSFTLNMETSGEGTVSRDPDQQEYEYGTTVEITANSNGDWEFDYWEGDVTGETNPITVTMDADKSIAAVFTNTAFAGGNGTEAHPYQVSTVEQLQAINEYLDACFIQINDIDASATANWNGGNGFKPIGGDEIRFIGTYDGNGYKISGLTINRVGTSKSIGLFGVTGKEAIIANVKLEDIMLTTESSSGALVGKNNGIIKNSYSTGVFGSTEYDRFTMGGLVGGNSGSIYNCHSNITISSERATSIGGLVGSHAKGIIKNSYAEGDISGTSELGGLVGSINGGEIIDSYASGTVNGGSIIGGLVGSMSGTVKNSNASGKIEGKYHVGGLIGKGGGLILNSYANNVINGASRVGGLVGTFLNGVIEESKALCEVNGREGNYTGGLVGYTSGSIINCYSESIVDAANTWSVGGLAGCSKDNEIKESYATGDVSGDLRTGGLIGMATNVIIKFSYASGNVLGGNLVGGLIGRNNSEVSVSNSYSTGGVDGKESVGGLVGTNLDNSSISNSYAVGNISGTADVGGLIGTNGATLESSYWDTESTNQSNGIGRGYSDGANGLTTSQMTGSAAKDNMPEFDWVEIWKTTDSYPALFWE